MCLHYRKNPRKEFLLSISPFHITPEKSLHCGVMMGHWPNFTLVLAKLYPKLWGNDELLKFSVLFKLIIVNWNPFQRWFSEVAPVSWHINFISRSYGRGVRASFVIFGCSLPHWAINQCSFFLSKSNCIFNFSSFIHFFCTFIRKNKLTYIFLEASCLFIILNFIKLL